ncbi:TBC1 domain family member 2A-like isoform X2 [Huso huso]|uniref:TBC1 domain family member 2A-like isoform X2 n=1 Tax=Huso huso TaxID=61971 RepID=A0ABR0Y1N3_HUSHU
MELVRLLPERPWRQHSRRRGPANSSWQQQGSRRRLELVRHKERCIADLDGRLEALLKDKEELEQRLAMQDCQVNELQQHVQLMMEKNNAKQEVILKLSEQVAACMADPQRTVANSMGTETFCRLQEKIEHLKGDIEAHKIQNKFLNSEIYQLTKLWRNSSEEEKGLLMKCAYLEAKNCQIESKYLVVLRRLQESKGLDSSQQEMVKMLIEDSLQGDKKDGFKLNPVSEYDDYGFKTIPDYEVEGVKLLAKIQALEIHSNNLRNNEMVDKPLRTRLDLHRTLTSNKHFSSPTSGAVQKLQRILLAFSWQNPTIGYCQGLNRLAAIALLVLKDEDAFWCLVAVVEIIMPQDYYNKTLTASQADQRVFRDFLAEKMPRLTAHFKEHSIDHSLITFNWFLVVFVESLVSDILLRVWDAFLYEGTKVIFRYALALFKYNEEDILKFRTIWKSTNTSVFSPKLSLMAGEAE